MAAFLSKILSRGKDKDKEKEKEKEKGGGLKEPNKNKRSSFPSLLEGKFEAVSPTVSPSVSKYEDAEKEREREREREKEKEKEREKERIGLFRPRSRTKSPTRGASGRKSELPYLTLNLNLPSVKEDDKKDRELDVVYEGLDAVALGEKRLTPQDALKLVRACSEAISSRGTRLIFLYSFIHSFID